ncbi:DUF2244 domain-containing protein [Methylocystis sp. IM3]|uniref:DUF2244 domain-containing protein n=1 Tax=unclassified Methylocystis TaxID=2625913 RepID=UPI000F961C84|nr:MAG: DUF2244 domain-containing protein [Hyphomicrobiales bacterium]
MSDPFDEPIFQTRLTPHRSLTPGGFYLLIVVFCVAQGVFAIPFLFMGAWPVAGFMGLDALALFVAFRVSFRDARAYETLDLTPLELVFAKVGAGGRRREWRFNPSWVRLEQKVHEEFGTQSVALVFRGEAVEVGSFLGPDQKAELAKNLSRALAAARLGPRFS